MMELFSQISSYCPDIELKSSSLKSIELLHLEIEPAQYMGMALFFSISFSVMVTIAALISQHALAIPLGLISFAISFGFFLILPEIEMRKRNVEIEAEVPFFLRTFGLLLEIGIPFQRAISIASQEERTIQKEMKFVLNNIKNGMNVVSALSSFATSVNSLTVKRAITQLLSVYETGGRGYELKKIGDDMLSVERYRLKEYSARSAMFGLLFIMSSAILPTFFLVYVVLGRFVLDTRIDDLQIAIALLVIFPLISILIMALSKLTMPSSIFSNKNNFDMTFLLPGIVFIGGFTLVPKFQAIFFVCGGLIAAYLGYTNYKKDRIVEEIEQQLPDALFSLSSMPKSTRPEYIFESIENGGTGALSKEAAKSKRQLSMNIKIDDVLDDLWKRNCSSMLKRTCLMIKQMIATNSLDRLSMLADDIIAIFQIKRERSQIFALQKYTLIFGAFLIPLIIKMTLHLLESMSGLFNDATVSETIAFAASVVPPYLVIYAMICSASIADAEGKKSVATIYFLVLALIGLLTFHFINL